MIPACRIDHHLGDREGADSVRPLGHHPLNLVFDFAEPANARAEDHTALGAVDAVEIDRRVFHRLTAGVNGELRETIEPLGFAGINEVVHAEVGNVTAKVNFVFGWYQSSSDS